MDFTLTRYFNLWNSFFTILVDIVIPIIETDTGISKNYFWKNLARMKTKDEIKEEIQMAEIGRDIYRAIRHSNNLRRAKLATEWESIFQRRLNQLTATLAKVQKRSAA